MKNVFTKKQSRDIIKKDYNPLKVNYKIYERGSELFNMEKENKKKISLEGFTQERIMQNANLFSNEELTIIKNNSILMEKIYILGVLDNI